MLIKVYSPDPMSLAANDSVKRSWEAQLGVPVDVLVRPCAKCPRAIIVIEGEGSA